MNIKTPNPASLGLAGFALTTWLLSMINAGWFSGNAMGMVLAVAFAYGGTAQALAGLMEIPRGNTFGATAFLSYGAFWWSLALFVLFLHGTVPAAFIGWYLFLWGVFTLYMWVATWRAARVLQLVFLSLWITFFVGKHATFGHAPPIRFRSMAAVFLPVEPMCHAMNFPASPVPNTTTS